MRIRRLLVSLSGGGYRAALFNAGVLRTLHEKGFIDHIHDSRPQNVIINAVSGGSIPAALWDRFLRSSEYREASAILHPERELIRLVTSSPSKFGRFNWHAKGFVFRAQSAWHKHLSSWWDSIQWKYEINRNFVDKNGNIDKVFITPGPSQFYPTFLIQTLDFHNGNILLFFDNNYIIPNIEFFKNGNIGIESNFHSYAHGIVSATAFPVLFPTVKIDGLTLIDAGLIDNQGILGFLPLMAFQSDMLLGKEDVWYLSDAGRSMCSADDYYDEKKVEFKPFGGLSLSDRIFRLTGDLSQPIVVDAVCNLISIGLGTSVIGVKMNLTGNHDRLWVEGKTIRTPQQSAQVETSLSGMAHNDAVAIIAHGAQCASIAFGLEESKQENLARRLATLLVDE